MFGCAHSGSAPQGMQPRQSGDAFCTRGEVGLGRVLHAEGKHPPCALAGRGTWADTSAAAKPSSALLRSGWIASVVGCTLCAITAVMRDLCWGRAPAVNAGGDNRALHCPAAIIGPGSNWAECEDKLFKTAATAVPMPTAIILAGWFPSSAVVSLGPPATQPPLFASF